MPVIRIRSKEILWIVDVETEWQEDLDIWTRLQYTLIDVLGVFELIDANGVGALLVAASVQRV